MAISTQAGDLIIREFRSAYGVGVVLRSGDQRASATVNVPGIRDAFLLARQHLRAGPSSVFFVNEGGRCEFALSTARTGGRSEAVVSERRSQAENALVDAVAAHTLSDQTDSQPCMR